MFHRKPTPWWRHKSYRRTDPTGMSAGQSFIVGMIFAVIICLVLGLATAYGSELALGDSLAVGFGQASGMPTNAKVGISSCAILRRTPTAYIDFVLVSAGTNDPPGPCVRGVRNRLRAGRVEWIVPVNGARAEVLAVAAEHGDSLLYYSPGRNWPHPAAYWNVHGGKVAHGRHHRRHR